MRSVSAAAAAAAAAAFRASGSARPSRLAAECDQMFASVPIACDQKALELHGSPALIGCLWAQGAFQQCPARLARHRPLTRGARPMGFGPCPAFMAHHIAKDRSTTRTAGLCAIRMQIRVRLAYQSAACCILCGQSHVILYGCQLVLTHSLTPVPVPGSIIVPVSKSPSRLKGTTNQLPLITRRKSQQMGVGQIKLPGDCRF